MSGILASSMIPQDASCKLYTNSSGNAASVTIHAHVPSSTDNACLSIKISGTSACICTNAVDKTTDIAPTDTGAITNTAALAYDGYTCLQNTGAGKRSIMTMAYVDGGDACHSAIDTPTMTDRMSLHGPYCSTGNRPVSSTFFGSCAFCCPRKEVCTQGSACCETLWAHMVRPMPNFHTSTSGERQVHLPLKCCNLSSYNNIPSYNYNELGDNDCCFILASTTEKKYETFYNTFDDSASCPGCGGGKFHQAGFMSNYTGWYAVDLWSCFGTVAYIEEFAPPSSCPQLRIKYRVRKCCEAACYDSCTIALPRCCACGIIPQHLRSIMLECCNCRPCCCNAEHQDFQVSFSSRKPVLLGCDFAILQCMTSVGSTFTGYRYDCAACWGNQYFQVCSIQPFWIALGSYMCDSCSCAACCIRTFRIDDVGAGSIKYAWYNPYLNCNYIYIMDGTDCNYGGTYSFEIKCIEKDGYVCCTWNTDAKRRICKNLSDYVSDGWFQKVYSTPTAWERFTCICSRAGCYTHMTNPALVGTCCWAVWAQCFNWGDTSLDATGWNGCMLRYHSNDLANWKLTDGSVILKIDQGSGDAICSKAFVNDGSNFSTAVNHYFNSANCVSDSGTIEYKTSLNRLERTGIVLSNNSNIYVNNTGSCVGVTVWGYDE